MYHREIPLEANVLVSGMATHMLWYIYHIWYDGGTCHKLLFRLKVELAVVVYVWKSRREMKVYFQWQNQSIRGSPLPGLIFSYASLVSLVYTSLYRTSVASRLFSLLVSLTSTYNADHMWYNYTPLNRKGKGGEDWANLKCETYDNLPIGNNKENYLNK